MKITLEIYDSTYMVESRNEDYNGKEMLEIFSKLLVQAGYPPNVIQLSDGGHYECEYKEADA